MFRNSVSDNDIAHLAVAAVLLQTASDKLIDKFVRSRRRRRAFGQRDNVVDVGWRRPKHPHRLYSPALLESLLDSRTGRVELIDLMLEKFFSEIDSGTRWLYQSL